MFLLQEFDSYLEMGGSIAHHADKASLEADMAEHYRYWQAMTEPGGELPEGTVVTLNADFPPDPSVYFLTITVPEEYARANDYPPHQTDLFFVIRDDTTEPTGYGDISEINGSQCGGCGAVNVVMPGLGLDALAPGGTGLPEGVKPVWRQGRDTPNLLCDECADVRVAN